MKVTNKMINKDIRLVGSILRPLTVNTSVESYRKHQDQVIKKVDKAKAKTSKMEKVYITREDGSQQRIVILKPKHAYQNIPAVLFFHGGGLVMGYPEEKIGFMEQMMSFSDCVFFAPEYTLGLDKPYPAATDDAYRALLWVKEHCEEYGCRSDQIFVAGESGGGCLAAAVPIMARDRKDVNIAFQMPLFPMLDDRCNTPSCVDNDAPMITQHSLEIAWELYLGELYGTDRVPAYAAPARLSDYSNLPPAYSYSGTIDPLHDEVVTYFDNLQKAGVEAKLDSYEGGFHGFEVIGAKKPIGISCRENLKKAFSYACSNYFAKQI